MANQFSEVAMPHLFPSGMNGNSVSLHPYWHLALWLHQPRHPTGCSNLTLLFNSHVPDGWWCWIFHAPVCAQVSPSAHVCPHLCPRPKWVFFSLRHVFFCLSSSYKSFQRHFADSISQPVVHLLILLMDCHNINVFKVDEIHFISFFCLWLMPL